MAGGVFDGKSKRDNALLFATNPCEKPRHQIKQKLFILPQQITCLETYCCDFWAQSDKSLANPNASIALGTLETALVTLY